MKLISLLLPPTIEFILSGGVKKVKDLGVNQLKAQVAQGEHARKTLQTIGESPSSLSDDDFIKEEIEKKFKDVRDFMSSIMRDESELFTESDIEYIKKYISYKNMALQQIRPSMLNVESTDKLFIITLAHPFNKQLTCTKVVQYVKTLNKNGEAIATLIIK